MRISFFIGVIRWNLSSAYNMAPTTWNMVLFYVSRILLPNKKWEETRLSVF